MSVYKKPMMLKLNYYGDKTDKNTEMYEKPIVWLR